MSEDALDAFHLDGKVAVITGGSRGLGRAMAVGFASAGATVVVASRNHDSCVQTARAITAVTGREATAIACHVGHWDDCTALFEQVLQRFGTADILVNNAGMSPLFGTDLRDVTVELWNKVLAVNLGGPFRLSALFGSHMHDGGGGSIINISSGAALHATPEVLPYAAAKLGLHALTQGFAAAYGPNVRVNTIVAGRFLTDVSRSWDLVALDDLLRRFQPLQRAAQPEEIVGTALYLASRASSFTTGAVISVDGGAPL